MLQHVTFQINVTIIIIISMIIVSIWALPKGSELHAASRSALPGDLARRSSWGLVKLNELLNVRALKIRIGFWGIFYYNNYDE